MATDADLQWGGRFTAPADRDLLAFGSSLAEDLVLAPFDVACSRAHVAALASVLSAADRAALDSALERVADEIASGAFALGARTSGAEDIHGAIDGRVRELAGEAGELLHTGRSRNDQVATTLLLYARDRATAGMRTCRDIALDALASARAALAKGTVMAAMTHWQPAQPILQAFWFEAVAEAFARAARRFARVASDAREACPLGSGACSGTSLPLDRDISARILGFEGPTRNALDAVGDRDVALDLAHAIARALVTASRISAECIVYATPQFGYARLADAASTGSSLMPQKRNPDPFELVRATAAGTTGALAGALASVHGIALSYHRDLQETKRLTIAGTERGLAALAAFRSAFAYLEWNDERLAAHAGDGFTVATDVADALIARGTTARKAHALVGAAVGRAESEGRALGASDLAEIAAEANLVNLDAPLTPSESVAAKATSGSTNRAAVQRSIDALQAILEREFHS